MPCGEAKDFLKARQLKCHFHWSEVRTAEGLKVPYPARVPNTGRQAVANKTPREASVRLADRTCVSPACPCPHPTMLGSRLPGNSVSSARRAACGHWDLAPLAWFLQNPWRKSAERNFTQVWNSPVPRGLDPERLQFFVWFSPEWKTI